MKPDQYKYEFGVRSFLLDSNWYHIKTRVELATGEMDDVGRPYPHEKFEDVLEEAKKYQINQQFGGVYFFPEKDGPQSYAEYILSLDV